MGDQQHGCLSRALLRSGRTTAVAVAITAASGMLETTGLPMVAAIDQVVLNLGAVHSEAEKLRQKVAAAGRFRTRVRSVAGQSAFDRNRA